MSAGAENVQPAGSAASDKPSPLAIVVLVLGIAAWMFGCCVSVPGTGLAIVELMRIQQGRSPAAGKAFAWFGLAASLTHVIISALVFLVLGAAAAALLYAGSIPFTDPCEDRAVCTEEGQCGTSYEVAGDGIYRCYVRNAADCRASRACLDEGRCAYDPRVSLECIEPGRPPVVPPPMSSVCELSSDCARWGRCALIEGACLAVREEDCARSLDCVVEGKCTLRGHYCVAMSDGDCAGSLECVVYGRCQLDTYIAGAPSSCVAPGERYAPSCSYSGAGADLCAFTGECLRSPQGPCETLESHGRRSPPLEDARRRIREAVEVEKPPRMR